MDWDDYFLAIAKAVSARAKCTRRQVGAVLVDLDHRIISTGYNGAASGAPECTEGACPRGHMSYDDVEARSGYDDPMSPGYCISVHAEMNALLYANRDKWGSTMYVTYPACSGCLKAMRAAGVSSVVYMTENDTSDELFLQR